MIKINYIDIHDVWRDEKNKHSFETLEETKRLVHDSLLNGIFFKDRKIEVTFVEFDNPLANKKGIWYYFICPQCEKKVKKLYVPERNKVACRKCSKIGNKLHINTDADRIFKIQGYLLEVMGNKKLSLRRKKQLINYIVSHYNRLDNRYKLAYNTFAFRGLQEWCLDNLNDKDKGKEYKEAMRDVLKILREIKKILIESGLSNKNLII